MDGRDPCGERLARIDRIEKQRHEHVDLAAGNGEAGLDPLRLAAIVERVVQPLVV